MLHAPRFFTPYYFASKYWQSTTATPADLKNRPKWGGRFFGSGYFQAHYFDTEVIPVDDYVSYQRKWWPQWCRSTDSTLYDLLEALATSLDSSRLLQTGAAKSSALNDYTGNEKSEWVLALTVDPELVVSISFVLGSTNVTPTITRSLFEYENEPGPVVLVLDSMIRARNLSVVSGTFTSDASGEVTLSITPPVDSILWMKMGPQFEPILPEYSKDGQAVIFYTLENQTFPMYYIDPTLEATTPSCRINSGPALTMSRVVLENALDAKAKVWGLTRFENETNWDLRRRLGCRAALWSASPKDRFIGEMAVDFGLCSLHTWETSGSLSIDPSQVVHIPNLPQIVRADMLAAASGYTTYSINQEVDLSYMSYSNRVVPVTPTSGFFTVPVSGLGGVVVRSQFTLYTTSGNASGTISISPNRNTFPGVLDVVSTQGVRSSELWDTSNTDLYLPSGCAATLLQDLAATAQTKVARCYGKSYWGNAYWFTEIEARPTLSYLPEELE